MYLAVRDYLLQNMEITKDLPNFEANFKDLQATIEAIQAIAEVQKNNTKGYAKEKAVLREKLITLVVDNSNKLNAFAAFKGDIKLQSAVTLRKSKLGRVPDTGLRDYAQIIFAKADSNIESLASYGITKETQEEMSSCISKYNAALSGPRVAQTETVKATKLMSSLFEHADLVLTAISTTITIIRLAQPLFCKGFETAKKVLATGVRSFALKAAAVDINSGEAVNGAKFTFTPDAGALAAGAQESITKTTASKGMFIIRSIKEGIYTVTVSKPGYKDKVVTVVVAQGELTNLKVEMEAA
jgi:hypothetical protein